jgi:tRNA nucleotidyltransferase (CCA-adding enzyme)
MLVVDRAAQRGYPLAVRFAALLHDLGKGVTDPAAWPAHHGHEALGVPLTDAVCQRLRCRRTAAIWR